jgi:DMSO/TMAO reductase YedYZ molybdopterin-dependent catalytic subunit
MKRSLLTPIAVVVLVLSLAACGSPEQAATTDDSVLVVTDGSVEKHYTVEDLKALSAAEATLQEVTYVGVPLTVLLTDAGFDPHASKAVKAVATDGFTVNYGPELFLLDNTLVAYRSIDGALTAEDGTFRMVLPDQEGKLNVRMLTKLQVVQ